MRPKWTHAVLSASSRIDGRVVDEKTRQHLLQLNQAFYETFAESFSATRFGFQPGYSRIIRYFPPICHVLDLGCGNGRFALFLDTHVERAVYVGIDGSRRLIDHARRMAARLQRVQARFFVADLTGDEWLRLAPEETFDVVLALAVLHHIPGYEMRARFVQRAASRARPGGYVILSNWRFTHNERMRRKIVPWQEVGLSPQDVEPGDYVLDWKRDGVGYRYVHQLDEEEVNALARAAGLTVIEHFYSDGREGDLSLYSVLQKPTSTPRQGTPDDIHKEARA